MSGDSAKSKLFQFYPSPFCAKVRKILEYKGVPHETIEVDYLDRGELLAASGQIMVPVWREDGEATFDSNRIAERLECLYPEPTIFPPGIAGLHRALTEYFDNQVEDAVFRVAVLDELEYFKARGPQHLAFFRLIRDRKYGEGFCDRMAREENQNWERVRKILAPLDQALADKAFVLGRIGLADFALYGQLWFLAFTGKLKIPAEFANLRAFFARVDRITASLEGVNI
ncbi:MAG TPA: glutathione S-transferase family protein [Candidatus Binataceae bacterium]|nr:glutathione S-transferase family protein [Candidatus Binataceae bacterium]